MPDAIPPTFLANLAPSSDVLTHYDEKLKSVYLRLLDADADKADWREVCRVVLLFDPDKDPRKARRIWKSHLNRARWMTEQGYNFFLQT